MSDITRLMRFAQASYARALYLEQRAACERLQSSAAALRVRDGMPRTNEAAWAELSRVIGAARAQS